MVRVYFVKIIKKLLRYIQPYKFVHVEVGQINSGWILKEKNIVVTGGGSGLGLAMAEKFVSEGANVIIVGRKKEPLIKTVERLGNKCKYICYDVNNTDGVDTFVQECIKCWGTIDCLVSNAGISFHEKSIIEVSEKDFDSQFQTNLKANYFLCKAFIQEAVKGNNYISNILFISSETGDMCYDIPYGMTKAGLNTLTRALARRYYEKGIRVNAIAPGVTLSGMTKYAVSDDGNMSRNCAAGRIFLPEEVAEVACFLLSDASKCISGEIIHTNAGNHLRVFWE